MGNPNSSRCERRRKRLRQPGVEAPRDGRAGERVEEIVRSGAARRRRVATAAGMPAPTSSPRRSASPGAYGRALHLLRLGQRALAVEPPERHLGMDLEHARRRAGVGAQGLVDLADLRRDHEQLLRDLARRIGGLQRDAAGFAIVVGIDRAARRHREHRGLALVRAAAAPRSPARVRHGRRAPAGRSACRPRRSPAVRAPPECPRSAARCARGRRRRTGARTRRPSRARQPSTPASQSASDDIELLHGPACRDALVAEQREIERDEFAVHDQLGDRAAGGGRLLQAVAREAVREDEIARSPDARPITAFWSSVL